MHGYSRVPTQVVGNSILPATADEAASAGPHRLGPDVQIPNPGKRAFACWFLRTFAQLARLVWRKTPCRWYVALWVCACSLAVYLIVGELGCAEIARVFRHGCQDENETLVSIENITVLPSALRDGSAPVPSLPGGIPKILHQTWKERSRVPRTWGAWCESWSAHHPGWLHVLWTDAEARRFIEREHPAALPLYKNYLHDIERADMIRPYILSTFGGVYVDMDFEALGSIAPAVSDYGLYIVESPYRKWETVQNSLMASRPGHPFWPVVFALLWERKSEWWHLYSSPLKSTGPALLGEAEARYNASMATRGVADRVHHLEWRRFLKGRPRPSGPGVTLHHNSISWGWRSERDSAQSVCMWIALATLLTAACLELRLRACHRGEDGAVE